MHSSAPVALAASAAACGFAHAHTHSSVPVPTDARKSVAGEGVPVNASAPQCCHCGWRGSHSPNCPFRRAA
ncbi:hypothetical protein FA95DRAFT_1486911 [Auriscalpium vulgare]|uniref:Uncharacterized protein n=1 Tax=Auriscalpium vulgare TaxID=40419 RepID=A0ACB8S377_9AGAM|nr:hypothetical protein FA95DRAFT_1486911 [Auriscalpium vulgare]